MILQTCLFAQFHQKQTRPTFLSVFMHKLQGTQKHNSLKSGDRNKTKTNLKKKKNEQAE